MNIKNTSLAAALSILTCVGAQASDGTVTVSGNVFNTTCTIVGNGTSGVSNFTVTLPSVSQSVLAVAGNTAGATAFTIGVTGCTGTPLTMTPFFEAGANVNSLGRLVKSSGTATNVEVQITNGTGSVVTMGTNAGAQGVSATNLSGAAGTSSFIARYYATGAAGAGTFNSSFTYSISYN